MSKNLKPEFDEYARKYSAGQDMGIKRLAGEDAESWVMPKVDLLLSILNDRPLTSGKSALDTSVLDYGCGTGVFLRLFRKRGHRGAMTGADISSGMLEQARKSWNLDDVPQWISLLPDDKSSQLPAGAFDVVVASSVLHHVPVAERPAIWRSLLRCLAPGGRLFVFEHNPCNPLVRFVVSRTPIDAHAILLSPSETRRGLIDAGAMPTPAQYFLFFPPRIKALRRLESGLRRFPMGGQYVVTAQVPFT